MAASALVIGQRNPMYSVLLLIASFAALAGLYIVLDAPFVAMAQMIVYAGAIMVLFLFVVMLLNAPQEDAAEWDRAHPLRRPGIAAVRHCCSPLLLVVQLAWALRRSPSSTAGRRARPTPRRWLGPRARRVLFTDYAFAFEATSVLILVAMVGAVVLARKERRRSDSARATT